MVVRPVRVRRECTGPRVSHLISHLMLLTDRHRIGTHLPEATFQNILRDLLWVASITPEEASPHLNPWLHANVDAFPSVWRSLLNNEVMQDDENLKGNLYPGNYICWLTSY